MSHVVAVVVVVAAIAVISFGGDEATVRAILAAVSLMFAVDA